MSFLLNNTRVLLAILSFAELIKRQTLCDHPQFSVGVGINPIFKKTNPVSARLSDKN